MEFPKFGSFYNSINVGASKGLLDNDLTLIWGNEIFFKYLGCDKDGFNSTFRNIVSKQDIDELHLKAQNCIINKSNAFEHITKVTNSAGLIFILNVYGFVSDETINGYHVIYYIYKNISDLIKEQNIIENYPNSFQSLNDTMINGLVQFSIKDGKASLIHVNHSALKILHCTRKEFTENFGYNYLCQNEIPLVYESLKDIAPNKAKIVEQKIKKPNGDTRLIKLNITKFISDNGIDYFQVEFMDITDANQALIEMEFIYENIPGFTANYLIKDNQIIFYGANNKFYEFFNTSPELYKEKINYRTGYDEIATLFEYMDKLQNKEPLSFTFRSTNAEGSTVWLRIEAICTGEREGLPLYLVVFIDTTETKLLMDKVEQEKERYRIAFSSSSDVIFEYDILSDTMKTFGDIHDIKVPKNIPKVINDYSVKVLSGKAIYPHHIALVMDFLTGRNTDPLKILISSPNYQKPYIWVMVEGTVIKENNKTVKTIGKLRNINESEENELKLLELSQKDRLTKLYSKSKGEFIIKNYLSKKPFDEVCSMLLIDIDHLQSYNNKYGFALGDEILIELSAMIKKAASNTSVCIREGGDEFLIFIKNTNEEKTDRIINSLNNIDICKDEDFNISISIGKVDTTVSENFDELMEAVKKSLSYAKKFHKMQIDYSFLQSDHPDLIPHINTRDFDKILSNYNENNSDIISITFEALQKTKNFNNTIVILLKRICNQFDLKKSTVFEVDEDCLCVKTNHQWCRKEEYYNVNRVIYFAEDAFEKLVLLLTSKSILDLSDVKNAGFSEELFKRFNIPTENPLLIFPYLEGGQLKGGLVFESAKESRVWKEETISIFREISRIIATHISIQNADNASKAKSDFLSRMSHEIRTPMTAIIGMTEIAKNYSQENKKTLDCLDKIDLSAKYLLSLINDILDISKIESGKMIINNAPFDLENTVSYLNNFILPQANAKNIDFKIIKDYTDTKLIGDSLRLDQILVNLLGNALKFTPSGGEVTLKIEQLYSHLNNTIIRFSVKDTGIGIGEENISKVFGAFEQADNNISQKFGGTGLGLAISSNLVRLMNGYLEVKSEVGKGSEFFFSTKFELQQSDVRNDNDENSIKEYPDFKGKRLLLVEDNELNIEIAKEFLLMVGFEVETANNGQQAINLFNDNVPNYYDAVLMDIRMPVMDGLEATKIMRTLGKPDSRSIPIVAMTANAFDEDAKKSMMCGMNGHLIKPIDVNKLYKTLKNLIL